ncbi:MAG: WD40 repeat domain-containing protein [Chloroflexota bacterium]
MRKFIWLLGCLMLAACGTLQIGIETTRPPDGNTAADAAASTTPSTLPASPDLSESLQLDRLTAKLIADTDGTAVYSLAFSPDGRYLAAMEISQTNLWDVSHLLDGENMAPLRFFPSRGNGSVCSAPAFSPDGRLLAVCGNGNNAWVWNTESGEKVQTLSLDAEPTTLAFHPDGSLLAVVASSSQIDLWNIKKGMWDTPIPTSGLVSQLAFTPDGKWLAAVGVNGGMVTVWDVPTRQILRFGYTGPAYGLAASPVDDHLVIASDTGDYPLYDLDSGTLINTLCPTKACYSYDASFAFSPDGRLLVTGNDHSSLPVRVWNVSSGQMLLELESGSSVAFHPSGRLLAAVSGGNLRIWRLDDSQPAGTLPPAPQPSPTVIPFPSQSQFQQVGALTMMEYPLLPDSADLHTNYDLRITIVNLVGERLYQNDPSTTPPLTVSEINAVIEPFGYQLHGEAEPYKLVQGGTTLREIPYLPTRDLLVTNRSQTDFVWAIHDSVYDGWLIHGKAVDTQYSFASSFFVLPQFIGDDFLALHNNSGSNFPEQHLQVTMNDQVVYNQALEGIVTDCPVERITIWNQHWILDMSEQVVMDGKPLSEIFGHMTIFEWRLFDNKPLYFFQDGGRYGLVYDGEEFPVYYDEIIHECLSVNNGAGLSFGIQHGNRYTSFIARRDGMWYFVTLELTNPPAPQAVYASAAAPSGCAIPVGQQVHIREEAYLWSEPDVNRGVTVQLLEAGASLDVLDGPVEGSIIKNSDQQGWFWKVSLAQDSESAGWIWQNRIQECP